MLYHKYSRNNVIRCNAHNSQLMDAHIDDYYQYYCKYARNLVRPKEMIQDHERFRPCWSEAKTISSEEYLKIQTGGNGISYCQLMDRKRDNCTAKRTGSQDWAYAVPTFIQVMIFMNVRDIYCLNMGWTRYQTGYSVTGNPASMLSRKRNTRKSLILNRISRRLF